MELTWAENVVRKTNKPVLILTPLAVAQQTVNQGQKFGIAAARSPNGKYSGKGIVVANYERLHLFDPNDFAGVVCDESGCIKHFGGRDAGRRDRLSAKNAVSVACNGDAFP